MSFSQLTDEQIEALNLLQEEAAEVIQDVAKILRHGLHSWDPTKPNPMDNLNHLCKELGDLEAAKELCSKYILGFNKTIMENAKQHKLRTVDQWLHHATAKDLFVPEPLPPRPRAPGEASEKDKALERMARALKDGPR